MNVSFLQELLAAVAERGRTFIDRSFGASRPSGRLPELLKALVSVRGEASGVALAREILALYDGLAADERHQFFVFLNAAFAPDPGKVRAAAERYLAEPAASLLSALQSAAEPPRRELFRRLNLAPGGTARIVGMRKHLLDALASDPGLEPVDEDLRHLLAQWFNRGFLVLRRIDWMTPANILEKLMAYEAVHEMQGWDDLRRRLDPADRRCFAFFHPSLIDEPIIFVEVALTGEIPHSIQALLTEEKRPEARGTPSTAVFYSISNCQDGLRGISFGNFLIKQVADELARELPSLKTFVTLSPVPGFARWLEKAIGKEGLVSEGERVLLQLLKDPGWVDDLEDEEELKTLLLSLGAHYFLKARTRSGQPADPVARFHLGNGARLERLNWQGDVSEKGLAQSHGLMVNYLYDLKEIERNHEAFANGGVVAASRSIKALLRERTAATQTA
jgi:malonyl-CoA decarboxylase